MASTFFGLNIARSGLFVSQQALNVVSHNVANADTDGYARQRLDTKQFTPLNLGNGNGMLGTGVDSEYVRQIRDEFLDFKYREENSIKGEFGFRHDMFTMIEAIFNEPSDSGIAAATNQFYEAVHELSKNPESLTTRALVRQRAIAFTENVGRMYTQLKDTQQDMNFELDTVVAQINGYAKEIQSLNRIIHKTEIDGGSANDVRDQRNLIVDKLSELVKVDAYEEDILIDGGKDIDSRFHVNIKGMPLVSHYEVKELTTVKRDSKLHNDDALRLKDVEWAMGGRFDTYSGKLKAILNMRDGDSEVNKGIPYYIDKLNEFANRVFGELNRIHLSGYGLKDASGDSSTGIMMFSMNGKSTEQMETDLRINGLTTASPSGVSQGGATALPALKAQIQTVIDDYDNEVITEDVKEDKIGTLIQEAIEQANRDAAESFDTYNQNNPDDRKTFVAKTIMQFSDGAYYLIDQISADQFTVSKDIDQDLNKIAASATETGLPGDKLNAIRMANMRHNEAMFAWGSPDDFVNSLVANLGVDTAEAERVEKNQQVLIVEVENKRQSIMGVSLDEEMSEMIKFQHAYSANARVLTTMDEMLDLIVNRLGLVGR